MAMEYTKDKGVHVRQRRPIFSRVSPENALHRAQSSERGAEK